MKIFVTTLMLITSTFVMAQSEFQGECLISYEYNIKLTRERLHDYNFPVNSLEECEDEAAIIAEIQVKNLSVPKDTAGSIDVVISYTRHKKVKLN